MASILLGLAFWSAASVNLVVSSYLLTLAIASLLPERKRTNNATRPLTRFAVIVPAHNEEALLPGLLGSLSSQSYPPESVHCNSYRRQLQRSDSFGGSPRRRHGLRKTCSGSCWKRPGTALAVRPDS